MSNINAYFEALSRFDELLDSVHTMTREQSSKELADIVKNLSILCPSMVHDFAWGCAEILKIEYDRIETALDQRRRGGSITQ